MKRPDNENSTFSIGNPASYSAVTLPSSTRKNSSDEPGDDASNFQETRISPVGDIRCAIPKGLWSGPPRLCCGTAIASAVAKLAQTRLRQELRIAAPSARASFPYE